MARGRKLQNLFGRKVALGAIIVFVVVTAVRLPTSDHTARKDALANLEDRLTRQAEEHIDAIQSEMASLRNDVLFLAATPPIQGIATAYGNNGIDVQKESSLALWKDRLKTIFTGYLQTHPNTTQVSYIGVADNGRELVRVHRQDGKSTVVAEDKLHQKGERDYFISTLTRDPGQVALSEINLNRERGRLERPVVPTLRASTPVRGEDGKLFGLIIINQNVGPLLKKIQTESDTDLQSYLMNSAGDFLLHPDAGKTFGFDLGQYYRWQDSFQHNSRDRDLSLQNFTGPDGEVEVITRELQYDPQAPDRKLKLAVTADADLVQAAIVQARNRVILALLATYAVVSVLLYLVVQAYKRHEEAGRKQAELAAIISHSRDAIIGQTLDGHITSWNTAAEKLFGYSADEAVGQSIDTLIVPTDRQDEVKAARRQAREGKAMNIPETVRLRADGSEVDVAISVSPILLEGEAITGASMTVRDITEQKQASAHILELNQTLEHKVEARTEELQKARKLADDANRAKSEFLANMSHEIRTPINAVMGMIQLLERTELTDRQADYAEKARSAARSLLSIINDILDFSKIEAGKLTLDPHHFVIDQLLRDMSSMLGSAIGDKNVEILFQIDPEVPQHLLGDSLRLKQILLNLAGNAVKFTEEGEVVIEVHLLETRGDDVQLEFRVIDTGIGMSQEQLQRIGKAFTQAEAGTTRRFGGTGLGLVISQRLIHLMEGDLKVESELGQGSRFCFTARMRRMGKPASLGPEEIGHGHPELEALRILVVDDNEQAREIISTMASALGWECDLASNGEDAVRRVTAAIDENRPYKVAFIDWKMPGMNGWETSEAIRNLEAREQLPLVVMITAHAREMLANRMASNQDLIDGFLVKPITSSDMMDAVAEALGAQFMQRTMSKPAGGEGNRLRQIHILVVEDNTTNQQVAQRLLEHEGARITLANGGLEAIDILAKGDTDIDAVLMDIQMPDLDGYETTRRIRRDLNLTQLPIFAMTANVMQSDREAALAAGMDEHIGKPFELERVVETLLHFTGGATAQAASQATPAPAETTASPDLPDNPPGFDFKAALNRLGNLRELYARQARGFPSQYGGEDQSIRLQMEQGDIEAAARRLHTLKGVAATLGANQLSEVCRSMERQIRGGKTLADLDNEFDLLSRNLKQAGETLASLAEALDTPASQSDSPSDETGNPVGLIEQLQALLSDSNMQAMTVYAQLRPQLTNMSTENLAKLDAAMDNLDFVSAHQLLDILNPGQNNHG